MAFTVVDYITKFCKNQENCYKVVIFFISLFLISNPFTSQAPLFGNILFAIYWGDKWDFLCYTVTNTANRKALFQMFGKLFDMDNPFWRWMGKVPELIVLSIFWFIGCIPIVTIIPSSCALFDAISRNTMMDDKGSFHRFWRSYVRELKQGIPLTIFWILIIGLSAFGAWIFSKSQSMAIFSIIYNIMIFIMFAYLSWLVPLQSRYNHKFLGLHINALKFFIGKLPSTVLMLLISAAGFFLCFGIRYTSFLIVLMPALIAVFHSLIVERAFRAVFPKDYEDGLPVYTEQERIAIRAINKAKQEEAKNKEEGY